MDLNGSSFGLERVVKFNERMVKVGQYMDVRWTSRRLMG